MSNMKCCPLPRAELQLCHTQSLPLAFEVFVGCEEALGSTCIAPCRACSTLTALKSMDGTGYERAGAVESTVAVLLEEDTEITRKRDLAVSSFCKAALMLL